MEWECCIKNQEDGAREGAEFIKNNIIKVTDKDFDAVDRSQTLIEKF
jgi:hypothetical protein